LDIEKAKNVSLHSQTVDKIHNNGTSATNFRQAHGKEVSGDHKTNQPQSQQAHNKTTNIELKDPEDQKDPMIKSPLAPF
jgi:hypothetical protein